MIKNENSLIHYGVLGMKWGVRRFQNYDGTRIGSGPKVINREKLSKQESTKLKESGDNYIIESGSTLYRVTGSDEDISNNNRLYVTERKEDSDSYVTDLNIESEEKYLDTYETNKNIAVAGYKEAIKILNNAYDLRLEEALGELRFEYDEETLETIAQDLDTITLDELSDLQIESPKYADALDSLVGNRNSSNTTTKQVIDADGNVVSTSQHTISIDDGTKFKKALIEAGYDAVVDINDIDWDLVDSPTILLDTEALKRTNHIKLQ